MTLNTDRIGERDAVTKRQPARRQVRLHVVMRQCERVVIDVIRRTRMPAIKARSLLERCVAVADKVRLADTQLA